MKFQAHYATCGPVALANALESIGITRSEEELIKLCKQRPDKGTSGGNLKRAADAMAKDGDTIQGIPLQVKVITDSRPDRALAVLLQSLDSGRPVVLCVDNWEHYVAAVGRLGGGLVSIVDSGDNGLFRNYPLDELVTKWQCTKASNGFWGLVI